MTRIITLALLIGITWAVLSGGGYAGPGGEAMLLGFLLLAAHIAGAIAGMAELPRITGYLLVGILVGPSVLGIIPRVAVDDLGR